jgi:tetratricopeptide (TPR) repeat protein
MVEEDTTMTQLLSRRCSLTVTLALGILALILVAVQPLEAAGRNAYAMAVAKTTKAEKALTKGDYERAEELFRDSIALDPMVPRPHLGLAAALVGQKRFEEALKVLEVAKEKYVGWDQVAAEMELERKQQAAQETLEFATFVGSKNPSTASAPLADQAPSKSSQVAAHRLESQNLLTRDRWDLEEIQRIPSQAYYLQGVSNLRLGRRDEGIGALELCLAINEEHGLAHYNLSVALLGLGQVEEAKSHLDAAQATGVEAHPAFVADLEKALQ